MSFSSTENCVQMIDDFIKSDITQKKKSDEIKEFRNNILPHECKIIEHFKINDNVEDKPIKTLLKAQLEQLRNLELVREKEEFNPELFKEKKLKEEQERTDANNREIFNRRFVYRGGKRKRTRRNKRKSAKKSRKSKSNKK